ncbi:MAG: hypothetical protein JSV12_03100, partial [Candidatus Bathyarchaeota archaeon]
NPNLTTGSTYTVSVVTDYNGSDITGYEFTLYYNPSVLHAVSATNGDLITTDVHPAAMFLPVIIDNTHGEIWASAFFFFVPPEWAPLTSGPGTLANVTFEVVGEGESPITLSMDVGWRSRLIGYTEGGAPNGTDYIIINAFVNGRQVAHGYFRNTVAKVVHDVAVVNVKLNSTNLEIGEHAKITVEIKNNGTVSEDVTINVERLDEKGGAPWPIGQKSTRNLAAGANTSLTFIFDTTGITSGTYIIRAEAEPVSGETDTEDNTLQSDETVTVFPALVNLFPVTVDGLEFNVVVESNSTISGFDFRKDQKQIGFSVTGPNGTIGFCNVTIPIDLMKSEPSWVILIDNIYEPATPSISGNETHTFLYFMYVHTTHNIIIRGTWVIPEFPIEILLLFVLAILAVFIIVLKRRT